MEIGMIKFWIVIDSQIKPKADWRAKRRNLFCFLYSPEILESSISSFKYFRTVKQKKKRKKLFVRFLGESMARQSAYGFI